MMNKPSIFLSSLIISACMAASAPTLADYAGPGAKKNVATNLADILKNPIDDQAVKLEGFILQKIGKERYLFSDGTQEIEIEIDDDDLPAQNFNEQQKVVIYGEVDTHMRGVDIDVDRVELK